MALNVTTAVIGSGCNTATASPSLAQWDQGQVLKIEGVDLPSAYQVEFSTEYTRNAIPKIGNANGVAIPNELLQRSAPITAYLVLHEGENDRETEYWITIHITPRTPPETITPDPEEQSVIDETIAALQGGVAAAEAAAESVQNMGVEAETLEPGSELTVTKEVDPETGAVTLIFGLTQGPKGDDGYSPTITITTITGGHRFTVTDETHPTGQSFDVMDGAKGDQGDDGYSPAITITQITGGHRFTVTDKTHPSGQSFDVMDGTKGDQGDDGYSPVVTITPITGGHRVTITDKTHPSGQSFDVMDGVIQSVNGKSAAAITLDSGDIEFDDSETYAAGSIGAEVSNQKNAIDQKAPVIINTASGDIATFADGADGMPIKHLVANIEAVQSGTGDPSPENIRPITGWTGLTGQISIKNLVPAFLDAETTAYGLTLTPNADGSIRVHGTATNTSAVLLNMKNVSIPVKAGIYTINCGINDNNNKVYVQVVYAGSSPFFSRVAPQTKTMANNFVVNRLDIGINAASGETIDVTLYPQFEVGSVATEYVQHQGKTISVSWATEAGTVYVGTLDLATGELTVTDGYVDLGDLTWIYTASLGFFQANLSNIAITTYTGIYNAICSNYPIGSIYAVRDATTMGVALNSNGYVYVRDPAYTDPAAFKTAMSGVQLVYELATPIVYHLDPVTVNTLLGNNTIYVDCGSVTVDYPADTGIVVARQSNAIEQKQDATNYVTLSGTIVTQTGADNAMYLCGELAELTFTAPATGQTAIRFTSGTTPTVATFSGVTWLNGFDPTAIEASKTYEINILNGLGVAAWT